MTDFLASPRSWALESFKCNGASLGYRSSMRLLQVIGKTNFTLQKLEMFANLIHNGVWIDTGDGNEDGQENSQNGVTMEVSVEERRAKWEETMKEMKRMLLRNELLRKKVHNEAMSLLTYSRPLLLCSSRQEKMQPDERSSQVPAKFSRTHPETVRSTPPSFIPPIFPFRNLPVELQHHILSLLSPTLSASQRFRIFDFASSPTTLKPLLTLPNSYSSHSACIPDPAVLPFSSAASVPSTSSQSNITSSVVSAVDKPLGSSLPIMPSDAIPTSPSSRLISSSSTATIYPTPRATRFSFASLPRTFSSPCAGGKCMGAGGSVLCHRYEMRMRWLNEVGCARFEAEERNEGDVMSILGMGLEEGTEGM
jgi:hypothetical protein